jgi:hypothetical protein
MANEYNDEYDGEFDPSRERRSRSESLMERRLRRSRGERVDAVDDDDDYEDDDDYVPRSLNRPAPTAYRPVSGGGGGSGCAMATLYLVLGGLATLLIGLFVINQSLAGIGDFFAGNSPDFAAIVASPTPQIRSGAAVIQRIQQLQRLETTSYTVERVIDVAQTSNIPVVGDFLAGDRLLLIAHGTVEAGIDLSQLDSSRVMISADGETLTVRLPPVEIFSRSLDNDKTRVYDRERGIFAPTNTNLETEARRRAEEELLAAACEGGILERANEDSRRAMEQFLGLLEFSSIEVIAAPLPECVPPG